MDNRNNNKSTSGRGMLLMTALTLSVFFGWHAVAEPDAQGGATTFLLFVSSYGTRVSPPGGGGSDSDGGVPTKMYWTDVGTYKIQRANRDVSNVEDLITTGLSYPRGIALGTSGPQ